MRRYKTDVLEHQCPTQNLSRSWAVLTSLGGQENIFLLRVSLEFLWTHTDKDGEIVILCLTFCFIIWNSNFRTSWTRRLNFQLSESGGLHGKFAIWVWNLRGIPEFSWSRGNAGRPMSRCRWQNTLEMYQYLASYLEIKNRGVPEILQKCPAVLTKNDFLPQRGHIIHFEDHLVYVK